IKMHPQMYKDDYLDNSVFTSKCLKKYNLQRAVSLQAQIQRVNNHQESCLIRG
ncbi:hypothetical protein PanWU01x14_372040, partial [Parasponia andersonii]